MAKFEVLEEGRLSKREMGQIQGGKKYCLGSYKVTENCGKNASHSSCPNGYLSCSSGNYMICPSKFSGETGPGGYIGSCSVAVYFSPVIGDRFNEYI